MTQVDQFATDRLSVGFPHDDSKFALATLAQRPHASPGGEWYPMKRLVTAVLAVASIAAAVGLATLATPRCAAACTPVVRSEVFNLVPESVTAIQDDGGTVDISTTELYGRYQLVLEAERERGPASALLVLRATDPDGLQFVALYTR